jgi:hypothetical protein
MKRRSIIKVVLYILGSIAVILSLASWIFYSFYFEKTLNKVVIPRIEQAAFQATHGRFTLTLDKIFYKRGTLVCNTFILSRVAYDSSEHGVVLERLTLDSARFEGISWWDILWKKDIHLKSLQMEAPKLYMRSIDTDRALLRNTHYDTAKKSTVALSDLPAISCDSIILHNCSLFLPTPATKSIDQAYRNITIRLTDFLLDPKRTKLQPVLFSKRVDFELPGGSYSVSDSMYSLRVKGIRGSLSDSLITVDTFTYKPNYSEQEFADRHKYIQGQLEFGCSGITVRGINFSKLLSGKGLSVRSCEAASWYVNYYGDLRKPHDPHPPDAVLPHTILNSIKFPIDLDSVILEHGTIHHQERVTGSTHASLLTFTEARVSASPLCTDQLNPLYSEPLHISVSAFFMGKGKVIATIVYPIHQKAFDLHVHATVGPFDLPVLNSYLVSNERKEILAGKCLGGELRMDVRSGVSTTTVSPRYTDLSMNVLATKVKESRGIFEGIKTFFANTFVLRTTNIDNGNDKAFSGTTTYTRSNKEEFFQFIWLALRKSIGKVVGF